MGNVGYWLGELLCDLVPVLADGDYAEDVPPYYDHLAHLMFEVMTMEVVSSSSSENMVLLENSDLQDNLF